MSIEHRRQGAGQGGLHSALQFLADDPSLQQVEGGPLPGEQAGEAEEAAAFLLAAAPTPAGNLDQAVLDRLPDADPAAFARLGVAVLEAWRDAGLNRRWREDPTGMATAIGLPPQLAGLARVVEIDAGRLPQATVLDIPLPPPEAAIPSRAEALRRLAATDFGWLLAGLPEGAGALGLDLPTGRATATVAAPAPGFLQRLAELLLRPRPLLASGSLACLALAVGLVMGGAEGRADLSGAAVGDLPAWRLLCAALSLAGALLLARAARRA